MYLWYLTALSAVPRKAGIPSNLYRLHLTKRRKGLRSVIAPILRLSTIIDRVIQTGEKNKGPISRAKIFINRIDRSTGERKDQIVSESIDEISKVEETSHAFVLRKYVGADFRDRKSNAGELEIVSRDLWNLLKKLLSHDSQHTFQGDPVTLDSPYQAFIHHWTRLEETSKESAGDEKDKQARKDLKLLLDTLSTGSGDPKLDKYLKTRHSDREQRSVTYETLWTLFPPGSLIYGKPFLGQDQVFIVQPNLRTWPFTGQRVSKWSLACWTYEWDGKNFKRVALKLDLESFEGLKPVTSLPFYPLEYHPEPEALKKHLIRRGEKYKRFCMAKQGSQMFDYKGDVLVGKKGFSGLVGDNDKVSFQKASMYSC